MDSKEKKLKVIIPVDVQQKIDNNEYILRGTQVRDGLGKIVCNLESLDVEDDYYFSPNIFLIQNNLTFVSQSVISKKLISDLERCKSQFVSIENKLDEVIEFQTNSLISKVSVFNELFVNFQERSNLAEKSSVFTSGVTAAAEIAAHLDLYVKRYLDGTIVFYSNDSYNGQLYFDYKKIDGCKPEVRKTKFNNFAHSKAFYFIYAFINIINNLNILSLCLDKKVHPRYNDNLLEVRVKLVDLIEILINGICNECDIYKMCYSTNYCGDYYPLKNLTKIVEFDSKRTLNDLILNHYPKETSINYNDDRIKSLDTCISLVKEIDSLLSRGEQLSDLKLEEIPEIAELDWLALNDE
ncbi:hypothetical protein [Vibrio mimicus]|uniref:hypothetical protein n=1 Tax=Vibrio mimicus TaxID=674 RepID=UPI002F94E1E8